MAERNSNSRGNRQRAAQDAKRKKEEEDLLESGKLTTRKMTPEERKRYGCVE